MTAGDNCKNKKINYGRRGVWLYLEKGAEEEGQILNEVLLLVRSLTVGLLRTKLENYRHNLT